MTDVHFIAHVPARPILFARLYDVARAEALAGHRGTPLSGSARKARERSRRAVEAALWREYRPRGAAVTEPSGYALACHCGHETRFVEIPDLAVCEACGRRL